VRNYLSQAKTWAWKWRWALFMNLFLLSPVFAYELRLDEGGPDRAVIFTLAASVLWLLSVQLFARRLWLAHAFLFPMYLVAGIDLFVIRNYHTRFASNMLLTFVENMGDAKEFLLGDIRRVASSLIALFVGYGLCMWKIRDLRVTLPRATVLVPLVGLIVVYGGVYRYFHEWHLVMMNDRNSPFGIFSQAYLTVALHQEELKARERAKSFHFGAKRASEPAEQEMYVLVIGESARRHNWSLYGYPRQTNPRLSKMDNLVVFRDVATQVAQTQVSVPLILTRGTIEDPRRASTEKSIVSVFSEVGFKTYWLSTQQRETAMASISHFTSEADLVRFFDHRYDMSIVDTIKEIVENKGPGEKKMFFVAHTLGSHFNLTSRYPPQFSIFPDGRSDSLVPKDSSGSGQAELIGAYDNTILYTDHVLAELIGILKQRPGIKALLYVPDHGDNLRDDERDLFGHAHGNEYDVPIPMLFWYSDEYARKFPEKVENARKHATRLLSTRNVFYSMTDVSGIALNDPELPRRSVFSPGLSDVKRMVYRHPKIFDFDEWLAQTGTKIPDVTPPK